MRERDTVTAATFDFASLRVCGRKYYVLALAGPVPHRVPRPLRLVFGPRWVVPLCSPNGKSPVSVEVADGESALEIDPSGGFTPPFLSDGEYGVLESDSSYDAGLPLSPEQAVSFATERTGRRANAAPTAIMIHPGNYGNRMPAKCMRWKISLDSPVRLRGQYGEYNTSEVYVRRQRHCFGPLVLQVADREQPDSAGIEYPVRLADGLVAVEAVRVPFVLPAVYDSVVVIRP